MNATLSLIGSPIKISGVKDLIHKYHNFFFDLDGVIVSNFSYFIVDGRPCNQRVYLGLELPKKAKQKHLLHHKQ